MLPLRPPDGLDDSDVVVTGEGTYWECGFTDWHLMLGWFAGPETLRRYPDEREQRWTVIETDAAGNRQVSEHPFAEEDIAEAEQTINEHLVERGLPQRPSGFRWFQLVPPNGTGRDVVAAYGQVQLDLPSRYDVTLETAYARAAVEELYGRPVTPPPPIPAEAWEELPEDPQLTAWRQAEEADNAAALTGPPGAVPILRCRSLARSLPVYATLGFDAQELSGYAVLLSDTAELHLSQTSNTSPGYCLIRVADAAALWHRLRGHEMLGPLEEDNPGMVRFTLLDPDNNKLNFVSGR